MIAKEKSRNRTVIDPEDNLDDEFMVYLFMNTTVGTNSSRPTSLNQTTNQTVVLPLIKTNPLCASKCVSWTFEVFNISAIGVYDNFIGQSKMFKLNVKPGPLDVERMGLQVWCKDMGKSVSNFEKIFGSGNSKNESSSQATTT